MLRGLYFCNFNSLEPQNGAERSVRQRLCPHFPERALRPREEQQLSWSVTEPPGQCSAPTDPGGWRRQAEKRPLSLCLLGWEQQELRPQLATSSCGGQSCIPSPASRASPGSWQGLGTFFLSPTVKPQVSWAIRNLPSEAWSFSSLLFLGLFSRFSNSRLLQKPPGACTGTFSCHPS